MSQLKKYKRLKYLGKGSYGAAILVELRSNSKQKFVIKEIVIGHLKPKEQQSAKSEAEVLHQMNHSNITMYIESFVENSKLYIVMEHADGGDLSSAISSRRSNEDYWVEEEVMRIFVQICLALKHVHEHNILHRDLKSQNIFLTSKGMVKLGDFGIAKVLDATDDQARTQIGTPYYLSPEICESQPYGRESDVWSLGVLLYEIIALEMPFQANSLPALVHRICSAEPNYQKVENKYSTALIDLVKSMLQKNPQQRPSVSQVVKRDFVKIHISKLLSYTLKVGNGGVMSGVPLKQGNANHIDAQEAEDQIEYARRKQREQQEKENSETQLEHERRQAQREAEREKLRKFRQEMARTKQRDGGNWDEVQVVAPAVDSRDARQAAVAERHHQQQRDGRDGRNVGPPPRVTPSERHHGGQRSRSPPQYREVQSSERDTDRSKALSPRSLAEIQAEKDRAQRMNAMRDGGYRQQQEVQRYDSRRNNESDYESAARREFFANRAAAQAFKARVEAMERPGAPSDSAVVSYPQHYPSNHREAAAGPRSRSGSRRSSFEEDDPQERIAQIKAQKEKERDRENALKEEQLRQAMEAHRQERKRLEAKREAVAFEVDIGGGGATPIDRNNRLRRNSEEKSDNSNINPFGRQNSRSPARYLSGGGDEQMNIARRSLEDKPTDDSGPGSGGRRGWGPPVAPSDMNIAKGVVRYSDIEGRDRDWNRRNSGNSPYENYSADDFDDDGSISTNAMFAPGPERASIESDSGKRWGGQRGDSVAGDRAVLAQMQSNAQREEEESAIMQRLRSKRASQLEARQQAKEMFKKLREKRRKDSIRADGKVVRQVVSPVRRVDDDAKGSGGAPAWASRDGAGAAGMMNANNGSNRSAGAKVSQARMMEMMNQVDQAKESVQRALAAGNVATASATGTTAATFVDNSRDARWQSAADGEGDMDSTVNVSANAVSKRRAESKADLLDDDKTEQALAADEVDDELGSTLDNWLLQQKRTVTNRRKHHASYHEDDPDDGVYQGDDARAARRGNDAGSNSGEDDNHQHRADVIDDDDDMEAYSTSRMGDDGEQANDGEMADMQYMLAQALIGEGEDDD